MKDCVQQRETYLDAVLAYFLIETPSKFTLPSSLYSQLFTPKTQYYLTHPVCQLLSEIRKNFNRNPQIYLDLQSHLLPEEDLLKQGIRILCQGWIEPLKQQQPTSPSIPSKKKKTDGENLPMGHDYVNTPLRRRMTATRAETRIEINEEIPAKSKRPGSSFLGNTLAFSSLRNPSDTFIPLGLISRLYNTPVFFSRRS